VLAFLILQELPEDEIGNIKRPVKEGKTGNYDQ
jgi:hypothetical protein